MQAFAFCPRLSDVPRSNIPLTPIGYFSWLSPLCNNWWYFHLESLEMNQSKNGETGWFCADFSSSQPKLLLKLRELSCRISVGGRFLLVLDPSAQMCSYFPILYFHTCPNSCWWEFLLLLFLAAAHAPASWPQVLQQRGRGEAQNTGKKF